jgi:hypothetical protein
MPLFIVGVVGLFSDICRASRATGELLAIINRELGAAGLAVFRKQRH